MAGIGAPIFLLGANSYLARSFYNWASQQVDRDAYRLHKVSRGDGASDDLYAHLSGQAPLSMLRPGRAQAFQGAVIVHFASGLKPNMLGEEAERQAAREAGFNARLAAFCTFARVRALIYMSSGGTVYGSGHKDTDEHSALRPLSVYGRAKVEAERVFASAAAAGGWTAQALRLSNPFGPLQMSVTSHGVIPALLRAAAEAEPFRLLGDGLATKDYIFIDDFCAALRCAASRPVPGPFNVSFGRSSTLLDLIKITEVVAGRDVRLQRQQALPGDVHDIHLCNDLFRGTYDWFPRVSLHDGIERMWQDYTERALPTGKDVTRR